MRDLQQAFERRRITPPWNRPGGRQVWRLLNRALETTGVEMSEKTAKPRKEPSNPFGLTERQWRFCQELIIDDNQTQAWIRAGYSPRSAAQHASRMVMNGKVQQAIAHLRAERAKRLQMDADQVLTQWSQLANADANELIEVRRNCCRHCYGDGFRYQRTQGERARALAQHAELVATVQTPVPPAFDEEGGIGYDARKDPHPECPECFGEGIAVVFVHDTRTLSPAARLLYAGAEETKDGIEIKMHDRQAALLNVAKHLGMFTHKHEHAGKDGDPLPGASEESPVHVTHNHGPHPEAMRSFLDDLRRAGITGPGVAEEGEPEAVIMSGNGA